MSNRTSMHDLSAGTQLANRYTLVSRAGGVNGAEIWVATDRLTRASVALKIVAGERSSAEQLRREWQTSIRLMHPHIVRVFEFHDDPGGAFYSLQYIDGPDLGILVGAPLEDILGVTGFIADALRYAHAKGVVHCDVKASNVLLDHNGAPYLIDFGVASDGTNNAGGGSLIAMSPQRLAGDTPQPSDDIFALGGLIYELISGRPPYSPATTVEEFLHAAPPPLDGSVVPVDVQQLIASMLDKSASERPTAESVAAALVAAGFAPRLVPARFIATKQATKDEVIETKTSVRPASRQTSSASLAVEASKQKGISPRTLGISLMVLLAVLVSVVFILPDRVTTDKSTVPVTQEESVAPTAQQGGANRSLDFNENVENLEGRDERVQARARTENVLGELLSKMETLEQRAVQRWAGLRYKQAQAVYAEGDAAYLARDYETATEKYRAAVTIIEPLLDEVDVMFATTFANAQEALDAADAAEALRLFELAVAISPSHAAAQAGYRRAANLDSVLSLVDQGLAHEKNLELDAARESFFRAVEIDPEWQMAQSGLERVLATINQMEFDQRMTEGLAALNDGDYLAARAAFRMAETLQPESRDPVDGLLQVDQGIRLSRFAALEQQALAQEQGEQWDSAGETYKSILELDSNLAFAQDGVARAARMAALHEQLEAYIADPDVLSGPSTMQKATTLFVEITRMPEIGPRLADQRDQLSRLLKRAATPLVVRLVSDSATDVSIYKVGKLGSFATHELSLRPGTYVAVGSRPGYRDVRLEFRVGPEVESGPIVVRCEEAI